MVEALRADGLTEEELRRATATGVILGAAELVGCEPVAEYRRRGGRSEWARGPWCWLLGEDTYLLDEPVPCKGRLGLWRWEEGDR
jgi:hypothetical protein